MSLDMVPKPFRPVLLLASGVAAVVVGQAWVEARITAKVDDRASVIATKVMTAMQAQLEAKVSEAAKAGATEAVVARVVPVEQRIARVEGWIEARQGRVEVTR